MVFDELFLFLLRVYNENLLEDVFTSRAARMQPPSVIFSFLGSSENGFRSIMLKQREVCGFRLGFWKEVFVQGFLFCWIMTASIYHRTRVSIALYLTRSFLKLKSSESS